MLLPREHGAYAELLFPLATGLAYGTPSAPAVAFAVAASALFLAHEPAAVATGRRGARLKALHQRAARIQGAGLSAVAVGAGAVGWVSAPDARIAALVPAAIALVLLPVVLAGREKSLVGELLVVATFAATVLPVARANGAAWSFALFAAVVWFVGFALGTVAVHAIKARHKGTGRSGWTVHAAPALAAVAVVAALVVASHPWLPALVPLAIVPGAGVALVASVSGVHPRHLKRVGWSLVGAHLLTLALLLAA